MIQDFEYVCAHFAHIADYYYLKYQRTHDINDYWSWEDYDWNSMVPYGA